MQMNEMAAAPNKLEIAAIKIISARLSEAREINKLTQGQVAQFLGIPTEELKKIETGVDIDSIPLWVIQKAAQIYNVSIDFLFGVTEDWEFCPEIRKERDFAAHLHSIFAQEQAKMAAEIAQQNNQLAVLAQTVTTLSPAIKAVYSAILRFWELNPEFTDMKNGGAVINNLDRADKAADEAIRQMVRHQILPTEALKHCSIQEPKPTKRYDRNILP
jgi:transcriptional regulator with XRE-family HTH domain